MKTRWLLRSAVLLGILGYGGCKNGDSPTEPTIGGLNLNGVWTGAITHYDSPARARESIGVALSQEGGALRGTFQTGCRGTLDPRGELDGDSVSGLLYRLADGSSIGQVSGTASRTSIRLTTWGPQQREEEGPPSRAVVNVIDLAR